MGADGGSIAGRADMVRTKKRAVSVHSVKEQAKGQSNSCALSQEPLRAPVVMCAMGQLFNKDALIEYMLAKQRYPHFSHITQLKDVSNVTLQWTEATATPASSESKDNSAGSISASDPSSEQRALYCCPITGLPSNGTNKFVAMQPCGCVISERALRQVGAGAGAKIDTCIVCSKELARDTPAPTTAAAASPAPAAASSDAASAAASSSSSSTAAASPATAASASPFHHPSYVTLYPGPEETLYLRALLSERIKQREADKLAEKLAKKAAKKTAAAAAAANGTVSASAGEPVDPAAAASSHKRKAEGDSTAASFSSSTAAVVAPPRKKAHVGAHAALVASRTGNVISDKVKQITEQAAQAVAERRKDANFNSMFLTPEQIAAIRFDSISTKPSSVMSML